MKTKKSEKANLENKRPLFFLISLVLSLGFVFLAFSWKTPVNETVEFDQLELDAPDEVYIPSTKEEKKEIAPPPMTVEDFDLVDNDSELADDDFLDIFDSEVTDEGVDVNTLMSLKDDSKNVEEDTPFVSVEEMPEFPGGMPALIKFIGNTVRYPTIAQETGVHGRVIVNFVINRDGGVSDARVLRSVDTALDKEALRVVNAMPKWKPGKQGGKTVRVSYTVPINFILN